MLVTNTSMITGKTVTMEIPVDPDKLAKWVRGHKGGTIQEVFPELSKEHREFLQSGITPQEWKEHIGMNIVLQVINRQRVEAINDDTKEVVGEAYRADVTSDWFVGAKFIGGNTPLSHKMLNVGRVTSLLPEVYQRKVILAMMKEIFQ